MTREQDLTGLVKAVKDFNKELEAQKGTIEILRDMQHTVHLSLASRLDDHYYKIKEIGRDLAMLRQQNSREATRKDFDLDSIELGTPEEGGRVKIYINSRQSQGNESGQIDATIEAMEYLKKKLDREIPAADEENQGTEIPEQGVKEE